MKHVVMGTAGHIDHGKTALVQRLTGVNTDRLEEEKRRGMTIELGFAPLTLPSGTVISIIDVPGHEKFVKTMVAGVTGIDFVMLVVAADEGVMPQTREHIDILSLLNVKSGVVALTKTDLVDSEWLDLAREDVKKALLETSLEGIPVIPVSSVTGEGIVELTDELEHLSKAASGKASMELFRLPVDRVFTMTGHGTVITGTVTGGSITKGEAVEFLPSMGEARVRGIQVHNSPVESAGAGDRCALNISGIEKDDIARGDVVVKPGVIKPTKIVDAVLYTVKEKGGLSHNQRVHVHIGTKEVLARIRVLGSDDIPEGSKGYVQLKFEEPVAAIREDRFIIRSFSPVVTIGGGWIIFHNTRNRQRFSEESLNELETGEQGSLKDLVLLTAVKARGVLSVDDIWKDLFADRTEIENILDSETEKCTLLRLEASNSYMSKSLYENLCDRINREFEELYKKFPFRYRIDREEIKSRVFNEWDSKDFSELLNVFVKDKKFELEGNYIVQPDRVAVNKIFALKDTAIVEKAILEDGLNIRNNQQLKQDLRIEENKLIEIERFLLQTGKIVDIGGDLLVHHESLVKAVKEIRKILDEKGSITAAQVRDSLGISRKIAIALLEHMDSLGITKRVEDSRVPGNRYMDYYV
jgi:selenocysteine-specific elongation factor